MLEKMKKFILWSLYGILMLCLFAALGVTLYFRADRLAIMDVFHRIDAAERTGDYAAAYSLMATEFRTEVPFTNFPSACREMAMITSPTVYLEWDKKTATVAPSMWSGGAIVGFVKQKGKWVCTGLEGWSMD